MTIANIVVERDRALIGVDTLAAYMPQGHGIVPESERRDRQTTKVWLYPHANMAMTGRGDVSLMAYVRLFLDHAAVRDFDHAVELMSSALPTAFQMAMTQRKQGTGLDVFPGVDLVLVGWSRVMCFKGRRWLRRPEDTDFQASNIDTWLALPEVDRVERVLVPTTDRGMEDLARKQMAWANENYPGTCGGRLMVYELTPEAISVRTVADLA